MVFDDERAHRSADRHRPPWYAESSSVLHVDPTPLPRLVGRGPRDSAERLGHPLRRQEAKHLHNLRDRYLGLHAWVEFLRSRDAMPGRRQRIRVRATSRRLPRSPCRIAGKWHGNSRLIPISTNSMSIRIRWQSAVSSSRSISAYRDRRSRAGSSATFARPTIPSAMSSTSISPPSTRRWRGSKSRAHRLTQLGGISHPGGAAICSILVRVRQFYPQRSAYELTFDALKTFASHAIADGYLPISLDGFARRRDL